MKRLNPNNMYARHAYALGVEKDGVVSSVEVLANTRAQARKVAESLGYTVRDVNMIG